MYCLPHPHIFSFIIPFTLSSTSVLYFAFLSPFPHLRPFPLTSWVFLHLLHFYSYLTFPMAIPSYPPPLIQFTSVQSLSCVQLFAAPWTAASHGQASLSITNSWRLLKLMFTKSVMPSNHLILYCPLFLLPSIFPSIGVFSNESVLIKWPEYWSFSISTSPSNEYSGLISFRMDRLDLLAVQGTLKSLLQNHSSKASILQSSAFFIVQLSHPHMTTGKTIALTRWTFVGKVMSLPINMLSRLVITFLPKKSSSTTD